MQHRVFTMLTDAEVDALAERVIGCAIAVHDALGPGLLESVYRECLTIELRLAGMKVEVERRLPLVYKGHRVADALKIDLLVEGVLVLELKAVERLHPVFQAQAISYLKLSGCPAGLILNFHAGSLRAGLHRVNHPDRHRARKARERGQAKLEDSRTAGLSSEVTHDR